MVHTIPDRDLNELRPNPSRAAASNEPTQPKHGGDLLTSLLIEHGVERVFGLPGGQTLALYDGIRNRSDEIAHVLVRDERSAAYAADGYARVTGRVGVCDATVGPGTAKLPSGLGEALGASIPVVALVSELPARLAAHRYRSAASQALDQATLLQPVTKWHATVPDATSMPDLVRQAFREASSGRPGPTVLFLPQDVLDAPLPPDLAAELSITPPSAAGAAPARFGRYPAFRPAPDPVDLAAAVTALTAAHRPMIVAGGGVVISGAEAALTLCAELLGAAVATSLSGKGAIAENHRLAVGVIGTMGTPAATAAIDEADVVLLVGTKAGSGPTFSWTRPRPDQTVVQLDIDPAELGRVFPLRAAVLADARAGLEALSEQLVAVSNAQPDRSQWQAQLDDHNGTWRAARDIERSNDARPIAPQRVVGELQEALGPDDILLCDASLSSGWGGVYLDQHSVGRKVLMPRGLAGLGYALPAAIGVATADRDVRTVVLTGDGALAYAVGEFATIIEQRLPITVVVLNNRSLGWIRWYRRITFGTGWENEDFADVDYSAVANAYGWDAERIEDPAQLGPAMERALRSGRPSLLDVITETWTTPVSGHRRAVEQHTTSGYGG
ncbi:MAG: acetolactate synthase large subunit [Pseudonocardiales bacterium]|nr:acetolactate synthase large subunit [Pseudonocardiales bacterium]